MKQSEAAVLFISGQSNAHAHGQAMKEEDRIRQPLSNVYSLDRDPNQSLDIEDVVWSGFTTAGKNLGEIQDHTYSFAYYFAKRWQSAIDSGADLPDLYIVQISIGSQGIINGMWNPDKEKVMIPGRLGEVNIALFPWALQVNRLVLKNLSESGKKTQVIGWHWIGSEQETRECAYEREDFLTRYDYFFDSMMESMGGSCPLYLYKLCLQNFCKRNGISEKAVDFINAALLRQKERFEDVTFVETDKCPFWNGENLHSGIFAEDDGHYLAKVQEWFADYFYQRMEKIL